MGSNADEKFSLISDFEKKSIGTAKYSEYSSKKNYNPEMTEIHCFNVLGGIV